MRVNKESKSSSKPVPTALRQTRARSKLQDAAPLMRGLDHRGKAVDPLSTDPEKITYSEVLKKLGKSRKIIIQRKKSPAPRPRRQSKKVADNDRASTPESTSQYPLDDELSQAKDACISVAPTIAPKSKSQDAQKKRAEKLTIEIPITQGPDEKIIFKEINWSPMDPFNKVPVIWNMDDVQKRKMGLEVSRFAQWSPQYVQVFTPEDDYLEDFFSESPLLVEDDGMEEEGIEPYSWADGVDQIPATCIVDGGRKRRRSEDEELSPKIIKKARFSDSTKPGSGSGVKPARLRKLILQSIRGRGPFVESDSSASAEDESYQYESPTSLSPVEELSTDSSSIQQTDALAESA